MIIHRFQDLSSLVLLVLLAAQFPTSSDLTSKCWISSSRQEADVDGLFRLNDDGLGLDLISTCFSLTGEQIATLNHKGLVRVFECSTGVEVASKQMDVVDINYVSSTSVIGFTGDKDMWRVWDIAKDSLSQDSNSRVADESKYPVGAVDRRQNKEAGSLFVSDGTGLSQLEFGENKFVKIIDWNALEVQYASLLSHHSEPEVVARKTFRRVLPTVLCATSSKMILSFGRRKQFVLSRRGDKWSSKLQKSTIVGMTTDQKYWVDFGSPKLSVKTAGELDSVENFHTAPYFGFYRNSFPSTECRSLVSEKWKLLFDFPNPQLNSEATDRRRTLLRITDLDSGEVVFMLRGDEIDLVPGAASLEDLKLSPDQRFISFLIRLDTKRTRSVVWDLSCISIEGKSLTER